MAIWDKIASRGHVEDRRSLAPAVGGLGATGIVLYLLFSVLSGSEISAPDILNQLNTLQPQAQQTQDPSEFQGADEYEVFASTVLGSNNELWNNEFSSQNKTYTPPKLVLFRTATTSSCGSATSEVGPHYCPLDQTIYLDETFFNELTTRFGAQGGDVAEAYVIAHEVGHHVQNVLGIMDETPKTNDASVKLELQADCFAGLWAHSIREMQILEPGEINEAIDAAEAVGDDRIQQKVEGYVNPESWTHGSSEQRKQWLNTGYTSGNYSSCNTFN